MALSQPIVDTLAAYDTMLIELLEVLDQRIAAFEEVYAPLQAELERPTKFATYYRQAGRSSPSARRAIDVRESPAWHPAAEHQAFVRRDVRPGERPELDDRPRSGPRHDHLQLHEVQRDHRRRARAGLASRPRAPSRPYAALGTVPPTRPKR